MVTVIVTHEVRDFDTWKAGYDSDDSNRRNAGFDVVGLYRAEDNPNMVTLISDAPSTEVVMGMFNNPQMQEMMASVGVIGRPDVKILNKV